MKSSQSALPRRLATLAGAVLGLGLCAGAFAPRPADGAFLVLDKDLYAPGDIPVATICDGIPGYFGFFYFSPEPDAINTTPFPGMNVGRFDADGKIVSVRDTITCDSNTKYIQAAVVDPVTREIVCVTNEVFLHIDKSTCDGMGGGEGCTPGYWKQEHHFDDWPGTLDPSCLFGDIFEDAFPGMTLLDVLKQGGGGLKALGRHTVAALLNAESSAVSYDLNAMDVIDGFNAVYPGTKQEYNSQKDTFEFFNEQGCPLGNNTTPTPRKAQSL